MPPRAGRHLPRRSAGGLPRASSSPGRESRGYRRAPRTDRPPAGPPAGRPGTASPGSRPRRDAGSGLAPSRAPGRGSPRSPPPSRPPVPPRGAGQPPKPEEVRGERRIDHDLVEIEMVLPSQPVVEVNLPDREIRFLHHEADSGHIRRTVPLRDQTKDGFLTFPDDHRLLPAEVPRGVAFSEKKQEGGL